MRRIRKKFDTPKHPWERDRINAEKEILSEYGLKNKKEIWKFESRMRSYMRQAKRLSALKTVQSEKEEIQLKEKLVKLGLLSPSSPIEDVLGLDVKQVLERRLQTLVFKKGLAQTVNQARQMIVHGHVTVGGSKITIPSYVVSLNEESSISLVAGSGFVKQLEEASKKEKAKKEASKKTESKKEEKKESKKEDSKEVEDGKKANTKKSESKKSESKTSDSTTKKE